MKAKRLLTIIALMALCITTVSAQAPMGSQQRERARTEKAKQSPEQIATKLAKAINLNGEQTEKFVPLYTSYMSEMKTLMEKHHVKHQGDMSDKDLEKSIENRFAISRSLVDLREKYYRKYKKFMSIRQIDKLYETEKKLDNRRPEGKGEGRKRASDKPRTEQLQK